VFSKYDFHASAGWGGTQKRSRDHCSILSKNLLDCETKQYSQNTYCDQTRNEEKAFQQAKEKLHREVRWEKNTTIIHSDDNAIQL
jgi:hypothetical protein